MGRVDESAPERQRAVEHGVDPEVREPERGPDDVDEGIERPDLVEGDVVGRDPVHTALGLGEPGEDREGAGAHRGLEAARAEPVANLGIRPMRDMMMRRMRAGLVGMRAVHPDVELRRGDARALDPLGRDRDAVEREACNGIPHGIERHAGVDQRADGHVATDAGKCIQKSDAHEKTNVAGAGVRW